MWRPRRSSPPFRPDSKKRSRRTWGNRSKTRTATRSRQPTATSGTATYLESQGLKVEHVKKVLEGRPHIVDAMKNGDVQLVFNTTEGRQSLADSFALRRTALMMKTPYYTTAAGALAAAQAIAATVGDTLEVRPLQSYG